VQLNWNSKANDFIIYRGTSSNKLTQLKEVKDTSYTDTGLLPNTTYYYEVKTKNSFGISNPSNIASVTTLPNPPQAPVLKVTSTSTSTINLSWTESSTNVNGYELYRSTDSVNFTQIATLSNTTNTYTDKNLTPNTKYYYKMKAYNKDGDSKYSNAVSAITKEVVPSAPSDLKATAITPGSVTLEWKSNSASQERFYVYRSTSYSGTYVKVANVISTKYTDRDLAHNTTYYYEVTAYNKAGESNPSNIALATTKQEIPFNPSDLKITSVSTFTISMTWKDNSDNEEGFNVYRATDGVHFTKIASVTQNATTYTDKNLKSDTIYYYKVSAYNTAGESSLSNVASTKTKIWIPTAPTDVEITSCSTNSVTLKWKPTYEATVVIYRKSVSRNTYKVYTENGTTKAKIASSSPFDFTPIATLSYKTNTYTDKNLEYNMTYYYKMRAYTKYGWSPFTSVASITTKNVLPKAPSNLKASVSGANSITLTWKDNSNNELGFHIWRKTDPNQAYVLIATVKANTTTYVVSDLPLHKNYWYIVSAYNSLGNAWSNSTVVTIVWQVIDTIKQTISNPTGIGVNTATNKIYVANWGNNTVSVISATTDTVVNTISVGSWPRGIGVNLNRNKICVANSSSNSVSLIDGNTDTVIATVTNTMDWPIGVGVNGNKFYVTNYYGSRVSVISATTDTVVDTISVGLEPWGIGVNPNTNKIYVANWGNSTVSVISATTDTVIATISVRSEPHGIGVNPNTNKIYVANEGDGTVSVIDGNTNNVIKTISVGSKPYGITVNPNTNIVYVANHGSDFISIINGNTNTLIATVKVGNGPSAVGIDSSTNKVYVANDFDSSVSVLRLEVK
jgi:YVTN family beta-propeller protein